jgi:hypothetical protein
VTSAIIVRAVGVAPPPSWPWWPRSATRAVAIAKHPPSQDGRAPTTPSVSVPLGRQRSFAPLPGGGPVLTWRAVNDPGMPPLSNWGALARRHRAVLNEHDEGRAGDCREADPWLTPGRTYLGVAGVLGVLMLGNTLNRLWSNLDFWLWLGAVREFAANPLDPSHPLLAVDAPDPYMGPYAFVLGIITRAASADPVVVIAIAGLVNLALVVGGLWRLTRAVSPAPYAPVLALVFTLVAWGWQPWRWSGYLNLNSIGSGLPYGSTFAFGIGLFCLASVWLWLREGGTHHLVVFGVGFPVVVLTHQMTGLWVAVVALGFTLSALGTGTLGRQRFLKLLAAVAVSTGLVLAWPFYSVLELVTSLDGFDDLNRATYRRVVSRTFLALPGLVILGVRLRRSWRDPLGLAAALTAMVFVIGWVGDRGSIGRVLPGLLLLAHLAMADWFAERLSSRHENQGRTRALRIALTFVIVMGLVGTAPGWLRTIPRDVVPDRAAERLRLVSLVEPNLAFAEIIPHDEVVIAPDRINVAVGGVAAKVISVGVPAPFVPDAGRRAADVATILSPATPASDRDALIASYRADWIVVDPRRAELLLPQLPDARVMGDVAGYSLIRLSPDVP